MSRKPTGDRNMTGKERNDRHRAKRQEREARMAEALRGVLRLSSQKRVRDLAMWGLGPAGTPAPS